jgi:hypothetical protein
VKKKQCNICIYINFTSQHQQGAQGGVEAIEKRQRERERAVADGKVGTARAGEEKARNLAGS